MSNETPLHILRSDVFNQIEEYFSRHNVSQKKIIITDSYTENL
jgi:hypothetical protein